MRKLLLFALVIIAFAGCSCRQDILDVGQIQMANEPSDLIGHPSEIQIIIGTEERSYGDKSTEYEEILSILRERFPQKMQTAQMAILWADQDGLNQEMMREQFAFLQLNYADTRIVEQTYKEEDEADRVLRFHKLVFPLTEYPECFLLETEEAGIISYGALETDSTAKLLRYGKDAAASSHDSSKVGTERLDFHGEAVTNIYTLDVHRNTTAQYLSGSSYESFAEDHFIGLLEAVPYDIEPDSWVNAAFIVFTEDARHYIYLDSDDDSVEQQELWRIWKVINSSEKEGLHIHWLTALIPSEIKEVVLTDQDQTSTSFQDSQDIEAIVDYLKHHLWIDREAGIDLFDGEEPMQSVEHEYAISIKSYSESSYILLKHKEDHVYIYSSDEDQTWKYKVIESCLDPILGSEK